MLTDPNVVLYSIILSGLPSMSVMKDIQGKMCVCQMPIAMRKQLLQEMLQQGLLASETMNFIVSSLPVSSEHGIATQT